MSSVSVVIPVRNDAMLLAGCLTALAGQDRPPEEVIIVDNGSTDDLTAVLATHPELPVRVLVEPEPGIPIAAAAGYDAAAGEFILRCDADSRPHRHWISRYAHILMAAGPEVVGVSGIARSGYGGDVLGRLAGFCYITLYRSCAAAALGHHALWGSNMAVRSSWWRQVRGGVHLVRTVHDDFDLSFQLRPGQRLLVDRGSVMPVSWRALLSPPRILRQAHWAIVTVRLNWSEQPHWLRLRRRWSAR